MACIVYTITTTDWGFLSVLYTFITHQIGYPIINVNVITQLKFHGMFSCVTNQAIIHNVFLILNRRFIVANLYIVARLGFEPRTFGL